MPSSPTTPHEPVTWIHPLQMRDLTELARVEDARAQTFRAHAEQRKRRRAERRAKWEVSDV